MQSKEATAREKDLFRSVKVRGGLFSEMAAADVAFSGASEGPSMT